MRPRYPQVTRDHIKVWKRPFRSIRGDRFPQGSSSLGPRWGVTTRCRSLRPGVRGELRGWEPTQRSAASTVTWEQPSGLRVCGKGMALALEVPTRGS